MTDLENCPFCGAKPLVSGAGERHRGLMIECMTDGCVNPHTSWYDHAAAIAAWNRRAPDALITVARAAEVYMRIDGRRSGVEIEREADALRDALDALKGKP